MSHQYKYSRIFSITLEEGRVTSEVPDGLNISTFEAFIESVMARFSGRLKVALDFDDDPIEKLKREGTD